MKPTISFAVPPGILSALGEASTHGRPELQLCCSEDLGSPYRGCVSVDTLKLNAHDRHDQTTRSPAIILTDKTRLTPISKQTGVALN